jgi:hypothetical protein
MFAPWVPTMVLAISLPVMSIGSNPACGVAESVSIDCPAAST